MRRFLVTLFSIVATTCVLPPSSASAEETPQSASDFAISVPAEVLIGLPNQPVEANLRVVNRTNEKTVFQLKGVPLGAGDDGKLQVVERDDEWLSYLEIPELIEVGPSSYVEVPVRLTVPSRASPDIYFVGFAVQPVQAHKTDSVEVRTQAVNHFAIEVPGPIHRSIAIREHVVPRLVIGNKLQGHFDVYNDGEGGVKYRGQVFVDAAIGSHNLGVVQADHSSTAEILPAKRVRTMNYHWSLGGRLVAIVRPTIEVDFTDGDRGVKPVRARGPLVVVVQTQTLTAGGVVLAFALVVGAGLVVRRKRRGDQQLLK